MIITLTKADFSENNIGTLSTWSILKTLGTGATSSNAATYVDRDAAYSTVITIADGYEIGSAGATVTMGGTAVDYTTGTDSDGLVTITISISAVTGNVVIKVPTVNTSTGEGTTYYTITYNYVDSDGTTIQTATTESVAAGTVKTFSASNAPAISGYTIGSVSPTSATVTEDITVTYTYAASSSDGDEDAAAFIAAAGITDSDMVVKLNTLVTSLKTANLWDKIEALYPIVGSTFESMSYNLKDPTTYKMSINLDESYLTIESDVSMNMSSDTSDSENKIFGTISTDVPSRIPGTDWHAFGLTNKESGSLYTIGVASGAGMSNAGLCAFLYSDPLVWVRAGSNSNCLKVAADVSPTPDLSGIIMYSFSSQKIVCSGVSVETTVAGTGASLDTWGSALFLNGYNTNNSATELGQNGHTIYLLGFGYGLTEDEMLTYTNILNEFKTV